MRNKGDSLVQSMKQGITQVNALLDGDVSLQQFKLPDFPNWALDDKNAIDTQTQRMSTAVQQLEQHMKKRGEQIERMNKDLLRMNEKAQQVEILKAELSKQEANVAGSITQLNTVTNGEFPVKSLE